MRWSSVTGAAVHTTAESVRSVDPSEIARSDANLTQVTGVAGEERPADSRGSFRGETNLTNPVGVRHDVGERCRAAVVEVPVDAATAHAVVASCGRPCVLWAPHTLRRRQCPLAGAMPTPLLSVPVPPTWQLAHDRSNTVRPRSAMAASKLPAGGGGAGRLCW